MTDIIEQLQENAKTIHLFTDEQTQKLMLEAADKIEGLQGAIAAWKHVVSCIACECSWTWCEKQIENCPHGQARVALGKGK